MKLPEGSLFGGIVGMVAGAMSGSFCWWYLGESDSLASWIGFTAAIGAFAGSIIGMAKRKSGGDVATPICITLSVVPALMILANGVGMARGKFTGLLAIGATFACPMLALVLGALFDRFYESARKIPPQSE